jgi:predicted acylesterase/phospholipase RssA
MLFRSVALDLGGGGGGRVVLTQGDLAQTVRASGAVPILFSAVEMDGRLLVDGGMVDKAPLAAAAERLGARSLLVHVLGSASLGRPPAYDLGRAFSPLRLQRRAVDAARWQNYQDQRDGLRGRGVEVLEIVAKNLPRLGPGRLGLGPRAFAAARQRCRDILAGGISQP